jgi:hypothetical protein
MVAVRRMQCTCWHDEARHPAADRIRSGPETADQLKHTMPTLLMPAPTLTLRVWARQPPELPGDQRDAAVSGELDPRPASSCTAKGIVRLSILAC